MRLLSFIIMLLILWSLAEINSEVAAIRILMLRGSGASRQEVPLPNLTPNRRT